MPSFTIPNSFGSPYNLREFNKYHEPSGSSKGGQFARRPSGEAPPANNDAQTASDLFKAATFVKHPEREPGHNITGKVTFNSTHLRQQLDKVFGFDDPKKGVAFMHEVAARMVRDVDPSLKFQTKVLAKAGIDGVTVIVHANDATVVDALGNEQPHPEKVLMIRTFYRNGDGNLTVEHNSFEVGVGIRGKGIGKDAIRNSVGLYRELGVTHIDTFANVDVGGYAWAKYGFLPNNPRDAASDFASALETDEIGGKSYRQVTTREQRHTLEGLANGDDPEWIWKVADHQSRSGKSLGALVLTNFNWEAKFDMSDERQVRRLLTYTGAIQ